MIEVDNEDAKVIAEYITANLRRSGYKGPIFVCVDHMAERHKRTSGWIAATIIRRMMNR